ncbi:uncharacterized protein EI90DRAFT_3123985 [Cantharellus anzutake]|uniref:uncharacterized protein n=1 Tax=Cantharellus anzutake TaxID=1750568 RepID=UPI001906EA61|nr:uncharacterized protein EI90DRAFT_3123985 [Cantharellus anzutake]KAF8330758.1 hypothetical protein EI90DRAFT_3123985 [Cantharellus anzutake]
MSNRNPYGELGARYADSFSNGFDRLFDNPDSPFSSSPVPPHSSTLPFQIETQSPILSPGDKPALMETLTESQNHQWERDKEWANEVLNSPFDPRDSSFLNPTTLYCTTHSRTPTPSSISPPTPASAQLELCAITTTSKGKRKRDEGLNLMSPLSISSPPSLLAIPERPDKRARISSSSPLETPGAGPSTIRAPCIQPPRLLPTKAFEPTIRTHKPKAFLVDEDCGDLHQWLGALFGPQSEVRGQTARLNNTKCFICKYTDASKADATQSTMKRHILSHFQETYKIIERQGSTFRQISFLHHMVPKLQLMEQGGHLAISEELEKEIQTFLHDHASIVPSRPFPATLTFRNQSTFSTSNFPTLYRTAKEHTGDLLEWHRCQCGKAYARRDLLKKHVRGKLAEKPVNGWNHGLPGRTGKDRWEEFNLTSTGEDINPRCRRK